MRRFAFFAPLVLLACTPPAGEPAGPVAGALPEGRWVTADGAGETALVFVPETGAEVALICAMGAPATFRVETTDAALAEAPEATAAAIVVGDVAVEGALARMATEAGSLAQMATPITPTLIAQLQSADSFRLNAGDAYVRTGAAPAAERDAFAAACASLAGLAGP